MALGHREKKQVSPMATELQVHYYGNLLKAKPKSWKSEALSPALASAEIDPVPHQIEAALFALENPNSEGVLIADEVGLGKTIESGLVMSQYWAEGKRSILVIVPTSIQGQWVKQLRQKFFLKAHEVTNQSYNKAKKYTEELFRDREKVIVTNEFFVASKHKIIESNHWDLVVIDEVHKLRNVWHPSEKKAKRAKLVRHATRGFKKVLLTATPIQNDLMELYGIISIISENLLGKWEWFSEVYAKVPEEHFDSRIEELKRRLETIYRRELRANVKEFIQYTNRSAHSELFNPPDEEEKLRQDFESYIARDDIVGIPWTVRALLRCTYLKLLASSTHALKNSLTTIFSRIALAAVSIKDKKTFERILELADQHLKLANGRKTIELEKIYAKIFSLTAEKSYQALVKKLSESDSITLAAITDEQEKIILRQLEKETDAPEEALDAKIGFRVKKDSLVEEAEEVLGFITLARKIVHNEKATAFIKTLRRHLSSARQVGHPEKAVVYTEFRETQNFLLEVLKEDGWDTDRDVVVFNGDVPMEKRQALVEEFEKSKKIFLSTEAGGEGLDLQFCNLVINFDLPWNPQRVEQRIGRCHRYGQKFDVIVINFVNTRNWADERVIQLLDQKFALFSGAFGASDTPIGTIESPVDFEKTLVEIYLKCRTKKEIDAAFDKLLEESKEKRENLAAKMQERLLKFDETVRRRIRRYNQIKEGSREEINRLQRLVGLVVSFHNKVIVKEYEHGVLRLVNGETLRFGNHTSEGEFVSVYSDRFRELVKSDQLEGHITFEVTKEKTKRTRIEKLVKKGGILRVYKVKLSALDSFELVFPIVFIGESGKLEALPQDTAIELFDVQAKESKKIKMQVNEATAKKFIEHLNNILEPEFGDLDDRNKDLFERRSAQIGVGLDIHRQYLEVKKDEFDVKIRELDAKRYVNIDEMKKIQTQKKRLNTERNKIYQQLAKIAHDHNAEISKQTEELETNSRIEHEVLCLAEYSFEIA